LKIGYPCINRTLECKGNRTFRLRSYSERRLLETLAGNLACLAEVLRYNVEHGLLFFRISSDVVPFASHPVNSFAWWEHFRPQLVALGAFVLSHQMRISMHPDQFTLLNALDDTIAASSIAELRYHTRLLDTMGLDSSAKVQIHIGGVYGDRTASMKRFSERYAELEQPIRARLVIENDHISYPLADCMRIHEATGVPVLFDVFHHRGKNEGEHWETALQTAARTWRDRDGLPMVDYSSQKPGGRRGEHVEHIDLTDWRVFLQGSHDVDADVMLEVKDKERSALLALEAAAGDERLSTLHSERALGAVPESPEGESPS